MDEPKHFRAAKVAAQRGDRSTAYQLIRQVLLENPAYAPAWVEMSKLVDTPQRERECLERALALDPGNKAAQDRLEALRVKELLAQISLFAKAAETPKPHKLGEFLVGQGLLSAAQLQTALAEQRAKRAQGAYLPLGEIILQRGWLTSQALAKALVLQQQEHPPSKELYRRLGEYLVEEKIIAAEHLETALAEQLALRQQGQSLPLGEILLKSGVLTVASLERILERQQREFYSSFGD